MKLILLSPLAALALALSPSSAAQALLQTTPTTPTPQALPSSQLVASTLTATAAGSTVFDLSGLASMGLLDDPENVQLSQLLGAGTLITGYSYTLVLSSIGESELQDMRLRLFNSDSAGLDFAPGLALDGFTGTEIVSGSRSFDSSETFSLGSDGRLTLTLYEDVDDFGGADANYGAGSTFTVFYSVTAVPEPAGYALMGVGLLALGFWTRRRAHNLG